MDTKINETVEMQTQENLMEAGVLRANGDLPKPQRKGLLSRTWARYVNNEQSWLEKQRGILILAALVVAGMAFHAGISPPGGAVTDTQNGRYHLGNAVQDEVDMDKYNTFVMYNTFTMILSFVDKWISTEEQVRYVVAYHCNIVYGRVYGGYLSAVVRDDGFS